MVVVDEDERSLSPVTPRARTRAPVHAASTSSVHVDAIKQLEDMATGYAMHTHELEATIDGLRRREREQAEMISDLERVVRESRVSAKDMQELEHMAAGYAAQVAELESRVADLVAEREASARQAEQLLKDETHAEEFAQVAVAQKQRIAELEHMAAGYAAQVTEVRARVADLVVERDASARQAEQLLWDAARAGELAKVAAAQKQRIAELEGSAASCEEGAAARASELQRRARESEERSERLEAVVAELRAKLCDGASTPRVAEECVSNPDIDGEIRRRLQLEAEICSFKLAEQGHLGKIAQLQEALQTQSVQTVHLCPSTREKDAQRITELEALASEMKAREQEHLREIAGLQSGDAPEIEMEMGDAAAGWIACAKHREMEELAIGHARRSNELEALVCTMREAEQGHLEDIRALRVSCAASEGLASERMEALEVMANHPGYQSTESESMLQKRVSELEEQLEARCAQAAQGAFLQMEAELQELRGKAAQQERECECTRRDYSDTLEQLRSCRRREQEVGSQVSLLEAEVEAHRQKEAELTCLVKAVQQREARIAEMEKQLGHGAEAAAAEAPAQVVERLASIPAAASALAQLAEAAAPAATRHAGSRQGSFAGPARVALRGACGGPGHFEGLAAPGVAAECPVMPPAVRVVCAEGRCASPIQVRAAVAVVGLQAIQQNPTRHAAQQRCASPVVVHRAAQPRCATPVQARHPPLVLTPRAQEAQQQRCASPMQSRPGWQQQGAPEARQRAASPRQPRPARAAAFAAEPLASQPPAMEGGFAPQDRGFGRDMQRIPNEGWSTATAPTMPPPAQRAPFQH